MLHEVFIVAAKRTPMGAFQGVLSKLSAPELGALVIKSVVELSQIENTAVDEVYMGCVLTAGLKQAPGRQAALLAGLAPQTPCTTINKVCGSGMKAIMLGAEQIRLGNAKIVVAGGMESMSNAPYLLDRARSGYRLGHAQLLDHMFLDSLEDAYCGEPMGAFAEATAERYGFSRADQDAYSKTSLLRAQQAVQEGRFAPEIVPVHLPKAEQAVTDDEIPLKLKAEKIALLKPAFKEEGTVTAANSSSIADGAAAVVLMSAQEAAARGLRPLAKIICHTSYANPPEWFTLAPIGAIKKLCGLMRCSPVDIALYEINEAFATVTMAALKDLHLSHSQVNIYGGACALGHPIGASGARLVVTLSHALRAQKLPQGVASLCIGGGEATAMALENVS